jgi:spore cortex biosynthesis protein YabQ
MTEQVKFFAWVTVLGMSAGFLYDFFRILRRTFKHPDALTQVEDLVYWLAATVFIFYFILHSNNGEIRWYAIFGVFAGMGLYLMTISKLIMKISTIIIDVLKKVLIVAINIILAPFKLLGKLLIIPIGLIKHWLLKQGIAGKRMVRSCKRHAKIRINKMQRDFSIIRTKI